MKRDEFISQGLASGMDVNELRKIFNAADSAGDFEDSPSRLKAQQAAPAVPVQTQPKQEKPESFYQPLVKAGEQIYKSAQRANEAPTIPEGILRLGGGAVKNLFNVPVATAQSLGNLLYGNQGMQAMGADIGERISPHVANIGQIAAMIPGVKSAVSGYQGLPSRGQEIAKDVFEVGSLIPVGKAASSLVKYSAKQVPQVMSKKAESTALKELSKIEAETEPKLRSATLSEIGKGKSTIYKQSTGEAIDVSKVKQPGLPFFKELDQSDARELLRPKAPETIPLRKYAEQQSVADVNAGEGVMDASQLAATNATKAFNELDEARKYVGQTIQNIVERNPGAKVDISDIKQAYNEMAAKTLNIKEAAPKLYDAKGNIINPSRPSIVSSEEGLRIHNEVSNILKNLPDELYAEDALALKRRLREKVKYDAQGQYRVQSTPMEGVEKRVAQLIDTKLDNALPGFKEANKSYSEYANIEDAFGRALGKELVVGSDITKHGASIMKRAVKSLADSDIRGIFKEVKRLTGGRYDLLQDAHYANIIMMGSPNKRMVQKASSMGELINAGNKGAIQERVLSAAEKAMAANRNKRIVAWHEKHVKSNVKE
jgi:hypothetical protein